MSDSSLPADTFLDFLTAYGEARPPSLQYSEGDDFVIWQRRFRKQLEAWRSPVPERVSPEPEVLDTVEEEDHTRLILRIPVTAITSVPAYLLVPRGLQKGEQRPGLLAVHGHYKHGIDSNVHYYPNHLLPLYRPYTTRLPVTEAQWQRILSIPLYPGLQPQEQERVIDSVVGFAASQRSRWHAVRAQEAR